MKIGKCMAGFFCVAAISAAVLGMTAFGCDEEVGMEQQMEMERIPDYTPMPFDGTVLSVEDGQLVMNRQFEWGTEEMIVQLTEETKILDAGNGYPVPVENLSEGESIRVYAGAAMTMSLPPMTNGVVVLCDVPQDAGFPIYTDVQEIVPDGNGGYTLTTIDGTVTTVGEETTMLPYLTRNIVRADDLIPGTTILLWMDAMDMSKAYKIVVFPEKNPVETE